MKIRRAKINDIEHIGQLFYDTITNINKKDYTPEQISIWVSGIKDIDKWINKINGQYFFVTEVEGKIAGFASITKEGYLDFMYVHKDFQGQGIATQLLKTLEDIADEFKVKEIWGEVSITARPFFKSKGFEITKIYTKKVGDVEFEDCIMTKKR